MKVGELSSFLSHKTKLPLQEDYDNSGLQIGDPESEITSVLLSLDVTEDVLDEAIKNDVSMIVSHHPLIFKGLKSLSGRTTTERIVAKAVKEDIAVYSAHTNLDIIQGGVSYRMAEKMGLKNVVTLSELKGRLLKVIVFVPASHLEEVKEAMYKAGGGTIGNYDHCSFSSQGKGTFRALEGADPFAGKTGEDHSEDEYRLEVMIPDYLKTAVIKTMIAAHPYEEVAYDILRLENTFAGSGLGCIGELENEIRALDFLALLEEVFDARGIRYSGDKNKEIRKVALCGGSGADLIPDAIASGADIYISADIKYHSFFEADRGLVIADIGHYESEKFSLEILYEIITKKFPKFAVRFSKSNKNPINYL